MRARDRYQGPEAQSSGATQKSTLEEQSGLGECIPRLVAAIAVHRLDGAGHGVRRGRMVQWPQARDPVPLVSRHTMPGGWTRPRGTQSTPSKALHRVKK